MTSILATSLHPPTSRRIYHRYGAVKAFCAKAFPLFLVVPGQQSVHWQARFPPPIALPLRLV